MNRNFFIIILSLILLSTFGCWGDEETEEETTETTIEQASGIADSLANMQETHKSASQLLDKEEELLLACRTKVRELRDSLEVLETRLANMTDGKIEEDSVETVSAD